MNLPPTIAADLDRELVRRGGLTEFMRQAWHVLEPRETLHWGWCLDALCEHLEAVSSGEIRRLLINIPPGTAKSLTTSVFWPAWEWSQGNAHLRLIGTSYAETMATRDSRRMRDLVQSAWYQARWPLRLDRVGEKSFANEKMGFRESVPFSRLTGGRAHRLIVDDPHSTEGAESDAERLRTSRIFCESAPSRLVDPVSSAIVVIMQRLHSNDVSGEILRRELGYEHLCLPMRFEPDHPSLRTTSIGFRDPRTVDGELLFPERFPLEVVERDEHIMGSFAVAGQFQQRPSPRGGNIVKAEWLAHRWKLRGQNPRRVILSLDCANKAAERNDPTAIVVGAEFTDRLEIWHVDVARREFPDLIRWEKDLYAQWKPTVVLIEDKAAGEQLIQQLRRETKQPILGANPEGLDKETRMRVESPFIEAGNLWLPDDAPWVQPFVDELITFPQAPHDDQVDALSQMLKWIRQNPAKVFVGIAGGRKESNRMSGLTQ